MFLLVGGITWAYNPVSLQQFSDKSEQPADTVRTKPRFPVKPTAPVTLDDTKKKTADLKNPDNVKEEEEYDDYSGATILSAQK